MNKLFFIFLFLFLLALPLVSSAAVIVNTGEQGLEIKYPLFDTFKQGNDINFEFHVFNKSNGVFIIDEFECWFHLYNSGGEHIYEDNSSITSPHDFDVSFDVPYTNFSNAGNYAAVIQCNTSGLGGFTSFPFEVTNSGGSFTTSQSLIYIALFGIIIFIFFITFFGIGMLPSSNTKNEEGKIIQISYLKYFRPILWFIEWILFIAILFLSSNIAFAYLQTELFAETLFVLFKICFSITPIIVIVWFSWIFAKIIQDKEAHKLLNRGIYPQGKIGAW